MIICFFNNQTISYHIGGYSQYKDTISNQVKEKTNKAKAYREQKLKKSN